MVLSEAACTDTGAINTLYALGFDVFVASSYIEALSALSRRAVDLVLCAERLRDGGWKDLMGQFAEMNEDPALVVLAEKTDSSLWAEAINLGAQDVLAIPLVDREVEHVVVSAMSGNLAPACV